MTKNANLILSRLKAKRVDPPVKTNKSADKPAIDTFIASGVEQVERIESAIKYRDARGISAEERETKIKDALTPRAGWILINSDGSGYIVKLGRYTLPLLDHGTHFAASTLEEAKEIVNDIVDFARENSDFRLLITTTYADKKKAQAESRAANKAANPK